MLNPYERCSFSPDSYFNTLGLRLNFLSKSIFLTNRLRVASRREGRQVRKGREEREEREGRNA
jgi:hypothetical protein